MTYRNMSNIMKLEHLAPLLRKRAGEARDAFLAQIERDVTTCTGGWELFRAMEYSDTLFKLACEQKLFTFLAARCERAHEVRQKALQDGTFEAMINESLKNAFHRDEKEEVLRLTPENALDVTFDDLVQWANGEFRYLSPLAKSSSASHNLAEQYMLQTVMDFRTDRMSLWKVIRDAQRLDPEWVEWNKDEELFRSAERKRQAEAEAFIEHQADVSRRAVKRLVRTVAGPHLKNKDALLGWPTLADAKRIRSDDLRKYVLAVHEKYVLLGDDIFERGSPKD